MLDYIFCNLYTYVTVYLILLSSFILLLFPRYSLKTLRHTSYPDVRTAYQCYITYIVEVCNFETGVIITIPA